MFYYGADYYPEQETAEEVARDAARMREQGFNIVRIGEFCWSLLEPEEGKYCLSPLTEYIDALGREGIAVLVCTPSACPPVWMCEKHPELLYTDNRGVTHPFGGRRHYCYNSEYYREKCVRMAEEIAKAVAASPYVVGFHIDNELGQEATGRCCCPTCRDRFREWLREKYGTIEELNRRAGTVFWGQTYSDFSQVKPPVRTIEPGGVNELPGFFDNPTLRLDYERFCSDSIADFALLQAAALRRYSSLPITTNSTGVGTNSTDYYKLFNRLDVASVDEYPSLRAESLAGSSYHYSFIRGLKERKGFWVVETSSGGGQGVWAGEGICQPFPGALRQAALHAAASGAEMFLYFQYKAFRYGAEQLEAAVMDIDGVERRRNREMRETAALLKKLEPQLERSRVANEAAVCFDYDSLWALGIKPFKSGFSYTDYVGKWHERLAACGCGADIIPCGEDIFRYKLVVLPAAVVISPEFAETLTEYVRRGGILIATYLTGIKGKDNTAARASVPAGLTELFGARVAEVDIVSENTGAGIGLRLEGNAISTRNSCWMESLELSGAETLAFYEDTFRKGETVASVNKLGGGRAVYIGTELGESAARAALGELCRLAGCRVCPFRLPEGVELSVRSVGEGKSLYFLFNCRESEAEAELTSPLTDVLSGRAVSGRLLLRAKETRLLTDE